MKIIDLHCDTLTKLADNHQHLDQNEYHIDLEKMKKGQSMLQVFAIFTHLKDTPHPFQRVDEVIQFYHQEINKYPKIIVPVTSYPEITQSHKMMSLLSLEEGDVIDDIEQLEWLYQQGVRMIAPLWNYKNKIGTPAVINQSEGLSEFGIAYIQKMESLGMIIDVSHLNDAGIYDVLKYTKSPIIASHSNARGLCNVPRNLPDELIIEISKRHGIIGINYFDKFLNGSTIDHIIQHIKYIVQLGGIDVVALGSDFDGISCELELKDASYLPLLINALKAHFTEPEIEQICYKNALRVFKDILK